MNDGNQLVSVADARALFEIITGNIGRPNREPPAETIRPSYANMSLDKYLQSVFQSFAGMNWKQTQFFVNDLTAQGKWMDSIFPIMTWEQAKTKYREKITGEQGDSFTIFSEWAMESYCYGPKTRRAPATIYNQTQRDGETRCFRYQGGGFQLPLNFALQETTTNYANSMITVMNKSILKTIEYEFISTWIDESIAFTLQDEMKFFPNVVTQVRNRIDTMRALMFSMQKYKGFDKLDAYAHHRMDARGVQIDTLVTSNQTLQFMTLTQAEKQEFASQGPPMNDYNAKRASMDPEGRGRTPISGLRVVASVQFLIGEEKRLEDPTQLLCTFGLFYEWRHTEHHWALREYKHSARNITVIDIAHKREEMLSFREAVRMCGIFNPHTGAIDETGRLALMLITGVMNHELRGRAEEMLIPQDPTQPYPHPNQPGMRSRLPRQSQVTTATSRSHWLMHWNQSVQDAVDRKVGIGARQGDPNNTSPNGSPWDPRGIHPSDDLPNIINAYTWYENQGWLAKIMPYLRALTDDQKALWQTVIDNQDLVRGTARAPGRRGARGATVPTVTRRTPPAPTPDTRVARNSDGKGIHVPRGGTDAPLKFVQLEEPTDQFPVVPVDYGNERDRRHLYSFDNVGCGDSKDRYVQFMHVLKDIANLMIRHLGNDSNTYFVGLVEARLATVQSTGVAKNITALRKFVKLNAQNFMGHYYSAILEESGASAAAVRPNPDAVQDAMRGGAHLNVIMADVNDGLDAVDAGFRNSFGDLFAGRFVVEYRNLQENLERKVAVNDADWTFPHIETLLVMDGTQLQALMPAFPDDDWYRNVGILNDLARTTVAQAMCAGRGGLSRATARYVGAYIYRALLFFKNGTDTNADFRVGLQALLGQANSHAQIDTIKTNAMAKNPDYYDEDTFKQVYPGAENEEGSEGDNRLRRKLQDTRLSYDFFMFLLEQDIPMPLNLTGFQPDITLTTYANLFSATGGNVAFLAIKEPEILWTPETDAYSIHVEANFKLRLIVVDRKSLLFIPHTSIRAYWGGGGTGYVDYTQWNTPQSRAVEPSANHGIFVVPLGANHGIQDNVLCTPGDWHPGLIGSNGNPCHYQTYLFATRRYGFVHKEHILEAKYYPPDPQGKTLPMLVHPANTICFRASWVECQAKDGRPEISLYKDGENCIGHKISVRTARILHGSGDPFDESLGGDSIMTAIRGS